MQRPPDTRRGGPAQAAPQSQDQHHSPSDSTAIKGGQAVLIQKNRRESLRVSVDEFKGRNLVSCRIWFQPDGGGDLRPGRDGWALAVDKLPELIAGLQQLEAEARQQGLLPAAQKAEPRRPIADEVADWIDGSRHG